MTKGLARYHRLYDNAHYQDLAQQIAADLRVDREARIVAELMNAVTDAALALCGHPDGADAPVNLVRLCFLHGLMLTTVEAIMAYLARFERDADDLTAEIGLHFRALLMARSAQDALKGAVQCASAVHGWRARTAYDLLAAADSLTLAATYLLTHGNEAYISEKLSAGLARLDAGLREAGGYSDKLPPPR